jgi:hypothetical protein
LRPRRRCCAQLAGGGQADDAVTVHALAGREAAQVCCLLCEIGRKKVFASSAKFVLRPGKAGPKGVGRCALGDRDKRSRRPVIELRAYDESEGQHRPRVAIGFVRGSPDEARDVEVVDRIQLT